jgi:hypothetical protein
MMLSRTELYGRHFWAIATHATDTQPNNNEKKALDAAPTLVFMSLFPPYIAFPFILVAVLEA